MRPTGWSPQKFERLKEFINSDLHGVPVPIVNLQTKGFVVDDAAIYPNARKFVSTLKEGPWMNLGYPLILYGEVHSKTLRRYDGSWHTNLRNVPEGEVLNVVISFDDSTREGRGCTQLQDNKSFLECTANHYVTFDPQRVHRGTRNWVQRPRTIVALTLAKKLTYNYPSAEVCRTVIERRARKRRRTTRAIYSASPRAR